MGVSSTNRIINPGKEYARAVKDAVKKYDARKNKIATKTRGFRGIWNLAKCSKCQRGMRKDIADAQIENKRENAPICIPCIMGQDRAPLEKSFKDWKPDTIKKFKSIK